jgi:hypothetical protein
MDAKKFAAIFSFYSLLLTMALAQGINIDFNKLISDLIPVIFILVFILILLAVGGVIKRPRAGAPWGFLTLFIILVIILFVVPFFIPYPQYLSVPDSLKQGGKLPPLASQVLVMLGLPEDWTYIPAIIYLFILPFAAIYTLVWAFLQSLGIFTNVPSSVNRILAFIIAFLTIPFGWFVKLVWILFSFMGAWSVVIFVVTFIVGVFFRGFGVARREYALALKTYESIHKELLDKLTELKKRVGGLGAEDIDREIGRLAEKYGSLYPSLKKLNADVLAAPTVEAKRQVVQQFTLEGKEKAG